MPALAEMVGDEGTDAAGVGYDGYAISGWRRGVGQEVGRLNEVVVVFAAGHAELSEDSVVDFVGAGEGSGVRTGGLCAHVGAAHFDEDDFLAEAEGFLGGVEELTAVFEAFNEAGDDADVGFVEEIVDEVGGLQVGFVAGGDDVGVAEAHFDGAGGEGAEGSGAALGNEGDGAGLEVGVGGVGAGPDAGRDVGDAEAVGAADAQTRSRGEGADFVLKPVSFFVAALGEAGGDDDGGSRANLGALLQYGQYLMVGDDDADEVWGFGQVGEGGVAGDAQDFPVSGIDGIDADLVLGFQHGAEEAPAVLGSGSSAHDGDGAGFKHPPDGLVLGV